MMVRTGKVDKKSGGMMTPKGRKNKRGGQAPGAPRKVKRAKVGGGSVGVPPPPPPPSLGDDNDLLDVTCLEALERAEEEIRTSEGNVTIEAPTARKRLRYDYPLPGLRSRGGEERGRKMESLVRGLFSDEPRAFDLMMATAKWKPFSGCDPDELTEALKKTEDGQKRPKSEEIGIFLSYLIKRMIKDPRGGTYDISLFLDFGVCHTAFTARHAFTGTTAAKILGTMLLRERLSVPTLMYSLGFCRNRAELEMAMKITGTYWSGAITGSKDRAVASVMLSVLRAALYNTRLLTATGHPVFYNLTDRIECRLSTFPSTPC